MASRLLSLAGGLLLALTVVADEPETLTAVVTHVIDGNTVEIKFGGQERPQVVRLIGLIAPKKSTRELDGPPALRVVQSDGRTVCLIVGDAREVMPTVGGKKKERDGKRRVECKRDILAAIREAGEPLTDKELVRILRNRKKPHSVGTIAKALADLTASAELVNRKDKRGCRLPEWPKGPQYRSLFD